MPRGGARKGAGRKPAYGEEGLTVSTAVSLPSSLVERCKRLATSREGTFSGEVAKAIRKHLKQCKA